MIIDRYHDHHLDYDISWRAARARLSTAFRTNILVLSFCLCSTILCCAWVLLNVRMKYRFICSEKEYGSKFLVQNCTFLSLAANLSCTGQCFQHRKGVSLVPWYEDTKSFTPSPPKNGFWPKNGQIWLKLAFLAKYQHFWPIWSHTWPKNNADKLPRWILRYVATKTFTYSHKN